MPQEFHGMTKVGKNCDGGWMLMWGPFTIPGFLVSFPWGSATREEEKEGICLPARNVPLSGMPYYWSKCRILS